MTSQENLDLEHLEDTNPTFLQPSTETVDSALAIQGSTHQSIPDAKDHPIQQPCEPPCTRTSNGEAPVSNKAIQEVVGSQDDTATSRADEGPSLVGQRDVPVQEQGEGHSSRPLSAPHSIKTYPNSPTLQEGEPRTEPETSPDIPNTPPGASQQAIDSSTSDDQESASEQDQPSEQPTLSDKNLDEKAKIKEKTPMDEPEGSGEFSCNICFDTSMSPVLTLCGHLFCWSCLHRWLDAQRQNPTCPVCKAGCAQDKVIPLYGRGKEQVDPRSVTPKRPAGQRPEPLRNPGQVGFGMVSGQVSFSGTMIPSFVFSPFGIQYGATYSGHVGMNGTAVQTPMQAYVSRMFFMLGTLVLVGILLY